MPATTHRVVNPPTGIRSSRYSLPFFMHPVPDCSLVPVVGDRSYGSVPSDFTAGAYLERRLRETGVA
jgi:isopenicillin N synthase-like dioxygenase